VDSAVAMNDLAVIVDLLSILTLKPYVILLTDNFNRIKKFLKIMNMITQQVWNKTFID